MKIRAKNKQLARLRKRNALAQTLRRELLSPLNVGGQPRQLAVDAAHRQPSGPRGPARRIHSHSEDIRTQAASLDRRTEDSTARSEPSGAAPAAHRNTARASLDERKESRPISGNPTQRKSRAHAQIIAYGAAAIADGTRIVRVDASVEIASVREGDCFGADAMGQSAKFDVVSVGFHPNCVELDRPLPRGRYGWSIQRDLRSADRGCGLPQDSAARTSAAVGSATVSPLPQMAEVEVATRGRTRDASAMRFDGKTRIERSVPRDPHLSNEANQSEGNEATFAFWLNRSATVIRDETLMLAVDQVTGEAFAIVLSPAVVCSSSTDAPFLFDLAVTPKSGSDARPVRWAIEHPSSVHGWQFIALVTDREGGVTLWLDGRGRERQQSTVGIAHHDFLSLGDGVLGNEVGGDCFETLIPTGLRDTLLNSFAVWSRSLSGDELRKAMSDSPLAATQDGSLQLYWRLSASLRPSQTSIFPGSRWPRLLVLDASGTLRHGLRITGLQSQQQDWRGIPRYDLPSDLAG